MFSTLARQRQKGVISVLAALTLGVAILIAALAVDLGHVFWAKRDLQKAADLASLSAVTDLGNAVAVARDIALVNDPDLTVADVNAIPGIYNWSAGTFSAGGPAESINSVQVTVGTDVGYFFLAGTAPAHVTATATAARKEPTARFFADSFLAGIDPVLRAQLLGSGNPVVDLGINVGLAGVTLQVTEPPAASDSGPARCIDPAHCDSSVVSDWMTRASTAQVKLELMVKVLLVTYTIDIEAAKMEAALTKIDCHSSPHSATILAKPGVLTVHSNGVPVVESPPSAATELTFTFTDPPPQTQTVPAAGLGGLLGSVPGLGLVLGPIGSVLDGALAGLGISLGGGDITVSELNCFPPQLVR